MNTWPVDWRGPPKSPPPEPPPCPPKVNAPWPLSGWKLESIDKQEPTDECSHWILTFNYKYEGGAP